MTERNNVNRGFRKLRVWQDAINLYVAVCHVFSQAAFVHGKTVSNTLDAAHSISRNIAEGYCRRSVREYSNFLNIALGSSGEFCSCLIAARQAGHVSEDHFQELDALHDNVENQLLKLVQSVQQKQKEGRWDDSFLQDQARNAATCAAVPSFHPSVLPLFLLNRRKVF